MTSALLLILAALSLDVSRSRTTEVPRSIERTLVRIGAGLAESYGTEENLAKLCKTLEGDDDSIRIRSPRLYVDDVRTGYPICRIARAIQTTALFVADRSSSDSSVELRYTLVYQGLTIRRAVRITDGQITSSAAFACRLGPQGRVRHVRLSYVARESPEGTTITSAATVQVNSGICPERSTSGLKVLNRLAGRAAAKQIDAALAEAEGEARKLSESGHEAIVGSAKRFVDHLLRRTR